MKKRIRSILIAVLLTLFIGSAGALALRLLDGQQRSESYQKAEELAGLQQQTPSHTEEKEEAPLPPPEQEEQPLYDSQATALEALDLAALQAVNEDVLGWILIPDTGISYPLLQGQDNQFYLNHTWEKRWSFGGSIFLDSQSASDFSRFNTIVYGHRMDGGSMFGLLHKYKDPAYWQAHPQIYIRTEQGTFRYEIFAAYEAAVDSWTYALELKKEEHKQSFLDSCLSRSVLNTGIVPTVEEPVLTLSTCTGNGYEARWVVQARLEGEITPPVA